MAAEYPKPEVDPVASPALDEEEAARIAADEAEATRAKAAEAAAQKAAEEAASADLAAHTAETTGAHGGIVSSADSRLTDARTPTAHAASHKTGGGDALSAADIGADAAGSAAAAQAAAEAASDPKGSAAAAQAAAEGASIPLAQKGAKDGVATLDGTTKLPEAQLPVSVALDSDVIPRGGSVTLAEPLDLLRAATTDDVLRTRVTGDTQPRFTLNTDGRLEWGPGNAVADTNLYREGAGFLKTGGQFGVGLEFLARHGASQQTTVGAVGPSAEAGVKLGGAGDTILYRSGAGAARINGLLRVDSFLDVGGASLGGYIDVAAGLGGVHGIIIKGLNGAQALRVVTVGDAEQFVIQQTGALSMLDAAGAYLEAVERAEAAPAPSANRFRLWCEDNGAGKTRLMVRFATGEPVQLAIEP